MVEVPRYYRSTIVVELVNLRLFKYIQGETIISEPSKMSKPRLSAAS
jgi:hypothetical protein